LSEVPGSGFEQVLAATGFAGGQRQLPAHGTVGRGCQGKNPPDTYRRSARERIAELIGVTLDDSDPAQS
jgi:hypothetical protein